MMTHNQPGVVKIDLSAASFAAGPGGGAPPDPGGTASASASASAAAAGAADVRVAVELPGGSTVFLLARQRAVLELLHVGQDVQAAARASGVGRATIYRWIKRDASFRAAHHDWHRMVDELTTARLRIGLAVAINTIVRKAAEGDVRSSIFLVRHLGAQLPRFHGATSPGHAQLEIDAEQKVEGLDAEMHARRARHREDDDLFGEWTQDHRR